MSCGVLVGTVLRAAIDCGASVAVTVETVDAIVVVLRAVGETQRQTIYAILSKMR